MAAARPGAPEVERFGRPGEQRGRVGELRVERGERPLGRRSRERPDMCQHHRIVVDVHDPAGRIDRMDQVAAGLAPARPVPTSRNCLMPASRARKCTARWWKSRTKGTIAAMAGAIASHGPRRPAIGLKLFLPPLRKSATRAGLGTAVSITRPSAVRTPRIAPLQSSFPPIGSFAVLRRRRQWARGGVTPVIPQDTRVTVTPIWVSCGTVSRFAIFGFSQLPRFYRFPADQAGADGQLRGQRQRGGRPKAWVRSSPRMSTSGLQSPITTRSNACRGSPLAGARPVLTVPDQGDLDPGAVSLRTSSGSASRSVISSPTCAACTSARRRPGRSSSRRPPRPPAWPARSSPCWCAPRSPGRSCSPARPRCRPPR